MSTGVAVNTGDLITAAKMNLKQEDGAAQSVLGILDTSGAGANELRLVVTEVLGAATRNLVLIVNDAARTVNLGGNLTLAAALSTVGANAISLTGAAGGSTLTLPATGTLATLAGIENLSNKTLVGNVDGTPSFIGATITFTGGTINLTAGAAYTLGTTDAFNLQLKANGANRLTISATLGDLIVPMAGGNVTLRMANPAAARVITFPDPLGDDTVACLAATQTLTNKTLTSPTINAGTLSGTFGGVATFSGATITYTGNTMNFTAGGTYTLGTTDAQIVVVKTNAVNKFAFTATLGQFTVYQTTANLTLIFSDPAAGRNITFPDPGAHDSVLYAAATQDISNKTIISATLNVTAGGAFTTGTTDANTYALKTGNTTRYTIAAASANVTVAGAATWSIPANTASAYILFDATTNMVALDTRNTVSGIIGVALSGAPPTIISAAGTTWSSVGLSAVTVTLTGGVGVTALNGISLNIAQPTVTSANATTVTTASTVYIANAPAAAGVGPASITNAFALHVAAGATQLQATNVAGTLTMTSALINFTVGGAATIGTTDANTLALKTGNTTRYTLAAASANVTIAAAATWTIVANTASAFILTDGAANMIALDSRNTASGVVGVTLAGSDPTIISAAGTTWSATTITAATVTLTGGVGVTAMNGVSLNIPAPTVTSGDATTVTTASTLYIAGAPIAAGGGPAAISNGYALHVAGGATYLQGTLAMTGATFNITAGGAWTFGTTDANTVALKTGGTTRWTWAAASANVTIAAASDIIVPAATASTLRITDGATAILALDSRVATDNVVVGTFTAPAPTFASAAGSTWNHSKWSVVSVTLTGGTGVTAMNGLQAYFDTPTLTSGDATTVTTASTIYIKPPVGGGVGPVTITNSYMINTSVAGCFLTAAGTWTDASSRMHKTSITPLSLKRVPSLLKEVQVVSYRRKDASDGGFERFGLIAEDAPDFLASPDHRGIAALNVSGFAMAAIKWLQSENEQLTERVRQLELKAA